MTVEVQNNITSGAGNDSTVLFSFSPMVIFAATDIEVYLEDSAGDETLLSQGSTAATYSVEITTYPATGSIKYPAVGGTPLATGAKVWIKRALTLEQQVDLENQGGYDPEVLEQQLDKFTMQDLQQQEQIDRSIKLRRSDTSNVALDIADIPAADEFLTVNSAGDGLEWSSGGSLGAVVIPVPLTKGGTNAITAPAALTNLGVTAAAQTVLDDATVGDMLTTLGVTAAAQTVLDDATVGDMLTTLGLYAVPGRNLIINGAHNIDQRSGATRTGLGATSTYLDDMWKATYTGSPQGRYTASIETTGGPRDGVKWLKVDATTAEETLGSTTSSSINQLIESANLYPINADAVSGGIKALTASCDLYFDAGAGSSISFPAKVAVFLHTNDNTQSQYIADVEIAADSTWERVSWAIPAYATAKIDNDNGQGAAFGFCLVAGSGKQATLETWEAIGVHYGTSTADNLLDDTDNVFGFTEVQLEVGSVATAFEHEDIGTTLIKCKRWFRRYTGVEDIGVCYNASTSVARAFIPFEVEMAGVPSLVASAVDAAFLVFNGGTSISTALVLGNNGASTFGASVNIAATATPLTAGESSYAEINTADFLDFSVEL